MYFYQVQSGLRISKIKKYCIVVLWTFQGTKIEKIERDGAFWDNYMKNKLTKFYNDYLLPELIDQCYPQSLFIKNPGYIIEAEKSRANNPKTK